MKEEAAKNDLTFTLDLDCTKVLKFKQEKERPSGEKYEDEVEVPPSFSGTVEARGLKYSERMDLVKLSATLIHAEKGVESTRAIIDRAVQVWDRVKDRIVSVNLKHIASGDVIDSVLDIEYSEHGSEIIRNINDAFQKGMRISKNSNP